MLRKLFHVSGIIIPVAYLLTDRQTVLALTAGIFIVDIILETLRIKGILRVPFIEANMKTEELNRLSGTFYYTLSAFITVCVFEKQIVVPSLFILCIADPLSSVLGSKFGKVRFLGKSLEGTMTFFIASFLILRIFSFNIPIAVVCGITASLTELFSTRFIDDNLSIPLVTALVLTLPTKF
jgi:dolichol kinase